MTDIRGDYSVKAFKGKEYIAKEGNGVGDPAYPIPWVSRIVFVGESRSLGIQPEKTEHLFV